MNSVFTFHLSVPEEIYSVSHSTASVGIDIDGKSLGKKVLFTRLFGRKGDGSSRRGLTNYKPSLNPLEFLSLKGLKQFTATQKKSVWHEMTS